MGTFNDLDVSNALLLSERQARTALGQTADPGMVRFLTLEQRSPEWHAWRANKIGGSDVGAILGLNPWTSVQLLWERKTGRAPAQGDNPAMARGRELEDEALAAWCERTGELAIPVCVERTDIDWLGASLDGMTIDGRLLVEIKCMGEKNHQKVIDTQEVPEYYYCQCQYQLACADADVLHFWAYRPEHETMPGVLIVVERDEAYITEMMAKLEVFWACVQDDEPPAGFEYAATEKALFEVQAKAKHFADRAASLKEDLIRLIPEGVNKKQGVLFTATYVKTEGAIDYKSLVEAIIALNVETPAEVAEIIGRVEDYLAHLKAAPHTDETGKLDYQGIVKDLVALDIELPEEIGTTLGCVEDYRKGAKKYWDVRPRKQEKKRKPAKAA